SRSLLWDDQTAPIFAAKLSSLPTVKPRQARWAISLPFGSTRDTTTLRSWRIHPVDIEGITLTRTFPPNSFLSQTWMAMTLALSQTYWRVSEKTIGVRSSWSIRAACFEVAARLTSS